MSKCLVFLCFTLDTNTSLNGETQQRPQPSQLTFTPNLIHLNYELIQILINLSLQNLDMQNRLVKTTFNIKTQFFFLGL